MRNPYAGKDFYTFFSTLWSRCLEAIQSGFSGEGIAADELQILVFFALAVSSAWVGTFLVLRRMTMLANALSHTVLLGIVIVYLGALSWGYQMSPDETLTVTQLCFASLIAACLTTFLAEFLTRVTKLQTDASIGLVFTLLFAVGVLLINVYTKNSHVSTELVMGNADALQREDLGLLWGVAGINLLLIWCFFPGIYVTTFDPGLGKTLGFPPVFYNYLLIFQTALTSLAAFRAVGVLLVLAFFVLPVLLARLFTHRLLPLVAGAIGAGAGISLLAVALSRHILTCYGWGLSTGGIAVTLLGVAYAIALGFYFLRRVDFSRKSF